MPKTKEEIRKVLKRHLREYVLVDRDMSYSLNIPDGATTGRDSVVNAMMNEIKEIIEEKNGI